MSSNNESVTPPMGIADATPVVETSPLTAPVLPMTASGALTPAAPPTAPRVASARDRITAQEAAQATGLGTVAGFTTMRHLLEEGFDPATVSDRVKFPTQ